jgi:hypothetical protein
MSTSFEKSQKVISFLPVAVNMPHWALLVAFIPRKDVIPYKKHQLTLDGRFGY